ncbi:unnamed protein product, partial [Staurois parvus]
LKHNTVQTKPNQPPTDNSTLQCKRRQAGRVNINRAGRYRGSKRRLVGVTGQVQQVASSVVQRVRQRGWSGASRDQSRRSQQRFRNRMQDRKQDTGPRTNTTPRQSLWVWP